MNKRVGVVSIGLDRLRGEFGSKALSLSGNNFGNILFTNAVYRQVPNCKHIGFHFDPEKVREEFDHILIPAANWVNEKEDWGFLADLIEECDLPVCLVGLGSQLSSVSDADKVPDGTVRFLKAVSRRSSSIGVRGEFTQEVLKYLGFSSVRPVGCPSIFSSNRVPAVRAFKPSSRLRVGVGPTRYGLPKTDRANEDDKQRDLYRYGVRYASSIYFQSEFFEISLLNRESVDSQKAQALAYYDFDDFEGLEHNIMTKGKYHKDIDQWCCDAVKDDVYVGTRIHGAVSAILAGTPAVLMTHDNRTRELSKVMGVPSVEIEIFDGVKNETINDLFSQFDFDMTSDACAKNINRFHDFYCENDLKSNLVL